MSKVIAASMVFVLVIGAGASAQLLHEQFTGIGLNNALQLLQGDQQASSQQNLVVDNSQCATGMCGTLAGQNLFASVGEAATAWGYCGNVGVLQELLISNQQEQAVTEGVGAKAQAQNLILDVGQVLSKAGGAGYGDALHTVVLNADQNANNASGQMAETATIMGMQTSTLYGEPGAQGSVGGTMTVQTVQSQQAL
ncbi:MAG: hypothetical protein JXQ75_05405 [Phycisphaerae bacterium]|nr:hypothetical protein [Phycisphaerae bacterium]